ncbi:MAG: energy transducer TonB [Acidobacteriota bacterium]
MSDPEDPSPFSSDRGTLASLGARKRWLWFGRNGADQGGDDASDRGDDAGSISHSMLDSLASRAGAGSGASEEEPERRSVLSLSGAAPVQLEASPQLLSPLTAHSTLGELAGLEEHPISPFPIERAILISLIIHVLLVLVLMFAPARIPGGAKGDLFAMVPPEKDDSPIPVTFQDVPGPARENPKRSPLSDADRRAGGGDPARQKSDTPYVPPSTGVAGLSPGPKVPKITGAQVQARPGEKAAEAQERAAAQPSSADQKPSEFPSPHNPKATGPKETTKLAGLDSAIREAARGAVGGEGGAPEGSAEGGFVDSGPVSFDSSWYDWGPYAAEMIRRIKLHWDVPELARLGWKGSLTVRFFILADGRVADAKILRGSGIPPFDFAAFQAIVKSSPFRPLPADLGSTREGVTVTFFYNMRPEEQEAKPR